MIFGVETPLKWPLYVKVKSKLVWMKVTPLRRKVEKIVKTYYVSCRHSFLFKKYGGVLS